MKDKVVQNYVYHVVYQVFVIFVPLITTPYVSRVLGSTGIGIFSYAESISYFFFLLGSLGCSIYGQREIAYVQNSPRERTLVFKDMVTIRFLTSLAALAVYLGLFCFGDGPYRTVFLILSLEVLASAFDISWFFMGIQDFRKTVLRNVVIKLLGVVLIFTCVHSPQDVNLYTLCYAGPVLLSNLALWVYLPRYLTNAKRRRWVELRHLGPMALLFLPQIATEVYTVLDKTMLGILASDVAEVAFYEQSQKMVKIVVRMVTALGIVMLPKISKDFAEGKVQEIQRSIAKSFQFVFLLGSPLMFGLIGMAGTFVPWFFGRGYDKVVLLMQVISPMILFIAISNVIGKEYLLPTKRQKAYTISVVLGAGINVVLNLILIPWLDATGAAIATVFAELGVAAVQGFLVRNLLPLGSYLRGGIRYLAFGGVMCAAVQGLGYVVPMNGVGTLLQVAVGGGIYLLLLLVTKDSMLREGIALVRKRGRKETADGHHL